MGTSRPRGTPTHARSISVIGRKQSKEKGTTSKTHISKGKVIEVGNVVREIEEGVGKGEAEIVVWQARQGETKLSRSRIHLNKFESIEKFLKPIKLANKRSKTEKEDVERTLVWWFINSRNKLKSVGTSLHERKVDIKERFVCLCVIIPSGDRLKNTL